MSNFSTVSVVVHHEEFKILNVVDGELVETVGEHELGSLVGTVTNVGHEGSTSETTSATTINTLGLSPVLLPSNSIWKRRTFILLNLSAWKRGKEVVLFLTILTLRAGLILFYTKLERLQKDECSVQLQWTLRKNKITYNFVIGIFTTADLREIDVDGDH